MAKATQLPDKLFFKIGEVAQLVGVKSHVLRYWESEFAALRPMKTRGSHRVYRRRDVELAQLIKRLLHDEGYTIPGAKKRLREIDRHRVQSEPDPGAVRETALRAELLGLREGLVGLLRDLDAAVATPNAPPSSARIERVVPGAAARAPVERAATVTHKKHR